MTKKLDTHWKTQTIGNSRYTAPYSLHQKFLFCKSMDFSDIACLYLSHMEYEMKGNLNYEYGLIFVLMAVTNNIDVLLYDDKKVNHSGIFCTYINSSL